MTVCSTFIWLLAPISSIIMDEGTYRKGRYFMHILFPMFRTLPNIDRTLRKS